MVWREGDGTGEESERGRSKVTVGLMTEPGWSLRPAAPFLPPISQEWKPPRSFRESSSQVWVMQSGPRRDRTNREASMWNLF